MRASRLLSILILLQLRPQITAPALAREFEAVGPAAVRERVAEWAGELSRRHAIA